MNKSILILILLLSLISSILLVKKKEVPQLLLGGANNLFQNSGNVGIGTTSPYSMLSVAGQVVGKNFVATSTSATSTFAGGVSLRTTSSLDTLTVNASNGSTLTLPNRNVTVTSAVILNARNSSDSSDAPLEVLASKTIFTNSGNSAGGFVGIGAWGNTTLPAHLSIATKDTSFNPALSIRQNGSLTYGFDFDDENQSVGRLDIYGVNSGTRGLRMSILRDTTAVGIGTSAPYTMLSVAGEVVGRMFTGTSTTATSTFSGPFATGTTTPGGFLSNSLGTTSATALTQNRDSGNWGVGAQVPSTKFQVGTTFYVDTVGNNIGVCSPPNAAYALDVVCNGTVQIRTYANGGAMVYTIAGSSNAQLLIDGGGGGAFFTSGNDDFIFRVAFGTEVFRLKTSNSRTGFGSTTPWAQLSVQPSALGSGNPEFAIGSTTSTHLVVDGAGRLGVGTSTPFGAMSVVSLFGATSTLNIGSSAKPSCIQLYSTTGASFRMWVNNAGTLVTESGACQ